MARVTGPLMSFDASGSVGKTAVFSKWKGRNYVRRLVVPANPKSALQVSVRAAMRFVTQIWATIGSTPQAAWNAVAALTNVTGLNAMVKVNLERNRQGLGLIRSESESAGTTPSAPSAVTATAGFRQVTLDWTAGANAPEFCWYVYAEDGASVTPGPDTLLRILPAATLSFIDTGLASGVERTYNVRGGNYDGELGAAGTQDSATPT